jgi:hypothetical protein
LLTHWDPELQELVALCGKAKLEKVEDALGTLKASAFALLQNNSYFILASL